MIINTVNLNADPILKAKANLQLKCYTAAKRYKNLMQIPEHLCQSDVEAQILPVAQYLNRLGATAVLADPKNEVQATAFRKIFFNHGIKVIVFDTKTELFYEII